MTVSLMYCIELRIVLQHGQSLLHHFVGEFDGRRANSRIDVARARHQLDGTANAQKQRTTIISEK